MNRLFGCLLLLLLTSVASVSCSNGKTGYPNGIPPTNTPPNPTRTPLIASLQNPTAASYSSSTLTPGVDSESVEKIPVLVPTFSPTPGKTELIPTKTTIPLAEKDKLFVDLTARGYRLISSGSIIISSKDAYSAYLYLKPELSPFFGASESSQDAFYIAFYRFDGDTNKLLGVQALPSYANGFPAAGMIVDWDDSSQSNGLIEELINPEQETRKTLSLSGFSSDINNNGLPEFPLAVEYCPTSCTHPVTAVYFYEIQSTSKIVNITADLPGLIYPEAILYSNDPPTIRIQDIHNYDIYIDVESFWIYQWDGKSFMDVSRQYPNAFIKIVESTLSEIQSRYNSPFDEVLAPKILKILVDYEKAGMSQEGLKIFLDVTDFAHWPGTAEYERCWLQISRAIAQEDFIRNRSFSMPPNMFWLDYQPNLEQVAEPLIQAGYDLSSCQSFLP